MSTLPQPNKRVLRVAHVIPDDSPAVSGQTPMRPMVGPRRRSEADLGSLAPKTRTPRARRDDARLILAPSTIEGAASSGLSPGVDSAWRRGRPGRAFVLSHPPVEREDC